MKLTDLDTDLKRPIDHLRSMESAIKYAGTLINRYPESKWELMAMKNELSLGHYSFKKSIDEVLDLYDKYEFKEVSLVELEEGYAELQREQERALKLLNEDYVKVVRKAKSL